MDSLMQSEKIDELLAARDKAQLEIHAPLKEAQNTHFKNRYATIDSVWNSFGDPLRKNGLEILQQTYIENGHCFLYTRLIHKPSGQWVGSQLPLCAMTEKSQAMGAAITYAKRYSLCAMIRPASEEDDDGNQASGIEPPSVKLVTVDKAKEWFEKIGKDPAYVKQLLGFYKVTKFTEIAASNIEAIDRSIAGYLEKQSGSK